MTEGNQTQAIFKLAIPFFLANVVNLVVLFADRVWIGVLGTTYLAAVGMAHAALVICVTTIMSPGIGTLTGVAKSVGANDAVAVSGYVRNGLFIGILTGVAFALGAIFVPDLLMSMMDQSGDNSSAVVAAASSYLTINLGRSSRASTSIRAHIFVARCGRSQSSFPAAKHRAHHQPHP